MNSKELNRLLVENIPCLLEAYDEEISWQEGDDTGSHTVFGDVLTPYFTESIKNEKRDELVKILAFVESILSIDDKYANEVIAFSVLENIESLAKDSKTFNENCVAFFFLGEYSFNNASYVKPGTLRPLNLSNIKGLNA